MSTVEHLHKRIWEFVYHKAGEAKTGLPSMVEEALRVKAWEQFKRPDGAPFDNLIEWLCASWPAGCGMRWEERDAAGTVSVSELIEWYCKNRGKLQKELNAQLVKARRKGGRPKKTVSRDTVSTGYKNATTRSTLQLRLQTERPKYWEEYVEGKYKTITAAAVAAGLRTAASNLQRAKSAWRGMSEEERSEFKDWIKTA